MKKLLSDIKVASRCAASPRQINNAPAHTSTIAMVAIGECRFNLQIQSAASAVVFRNLTPPDFYVFQSLKDSLCEQRQE